MNEEQKNLIKQFSSKIDEDKYNPILTSRDYDKYLEGILTILCVGFLELGEETKK